MKRILFAVWRFVAARMRPSTEENRRILAGRGESIDSLRIREATAADIPELARLHVETWNATYAPFLIQGPSVAIREAQWREAFGRSDPRWFCYVVCNELGELIGFAQANASKRPQFAGELNKIYVRRDYQRLGLGRQLMALVAARFLSLGIESMWLFGDPRNPSREAWIALGATKTDPDSSTGNYGWTDLRPLARQASSADAGLP